MYYYLLTVLLLKVATNVNKIVNRIINTAAVTVRPQTQWLTTENSLLICCTKMIQVETYEAYCENKAVLNNANKYLMAE